jgi:hypothetical protein
MPSHITVVAALRRPRGAAKEHVIEARPSHRECCWPLSPRGSPFPPPSRRHRLPTSSSTAALSPVTVEDVYRTTSSVSFLSHTSCCMPSTPTSAACRLGTRRQTFASSRAASRPICHCGTTNYMMQQGTSPRRLGGGWSPARSPASVVVVEQGDYERRVGGSVCAGRSCAVRGMGGNERWSWSR